LGGLQAGLVLHDCAGGLLIRGTRLVAGDDGAGLLVQQLLRPLQLQLAQDFCRLAALERALRLFDGGLEQILLDPVQGGAFLDQVAFLEQHGVQVARHARPDVDTVDRLHPPDEVERLGDRPALGRDGAHGDRGRLRLLCMGRHAEDTDEAYGPDRKAHVGSPPIARVARTSPGSDPSTDWPGATSAMNGILLFGWSTAVIFEEVPTTVRNVRLLAWPSAAERLAYFF